MPRFCVEITLDAGAGQGSFSPLHGVIMFIIVLMSCVPFGKDAIYRAPPDNPTVVQMPFLAETTAQCLASGTGGIDLSRYPESRPAIFAPAAGHVLTVTTDALGLELDVSGEFMGFSSLDSVLISEDVWVDEGQLIAVGRENVRFVAPDLAIDTQDVSEYAQGRQATLIDDLFCDFSQGHEYRSFLETPMYHPSGSLLRAYDAETIFLQENGLLRAFPSAAIFSSHNLSSSDVTMVTPAELSCYGQGSAMEERVLVAVAGPGEETDVWIVMQDIDGDNKQKMHVPAFGWQGILASWGFSAQSVEDIERIERETLDTYEDVGVATYRDGVLIAPAELEQVFVMSSGTAIPLADNTLIHLLGWAERSILTVDGEEFDAVVKGIGDCSTSSHCLTRDEITTCAK